MHPDNSEKDMSIKDFIDEKNNQDQSRILQSGPGSQQSRRKNNIVDSRANQAESEKKFGQEEQRILGNQSFSQEQPQHQSENQLGGEKVYETTVEYKKAFGTRARLVRTPPEK